jgi:hypothetical protein
MTVKATHVHSLSSRYLTTSTILIHKWLAYWDLHRCNQWLTGNVLVSKNDAFLSLVTYFTKNSIVSWIARTNKAVHSIDALSTSARLCCTIINIYFTHLSGEARHTLTCVSMWFNIVINETSSIVNTITSSRTWTNRLRTRNAGIPRWT